VTLVIDHDDQPYSYPIIADPDLFDCAPTQGSPCGIYNPRAAAAYAHKWFDKHNSNYPNFDVPQPDHPNPLNLGGDCTNFMSQSLRAGGMWFMREYEKGEGSWWVKPPTVPKNIIIDSIVFGGRFQYTQSWSVAEKLFAHLLNYNLGTIEGAGRGGTPIDGDLLHIGDVIFLDWDNHPNKWDHAQFVSGQDPITGEFLLTQHSSGYEKPLSEVNRRIRNPNAHGNRWGWAIMHPTHTRADLDFIPN
jgi:hypothetical protein